MGNMNVTVVDQNNVTIAVTPTPTQIVNVDRGILGPRGYSGISGYSGYSGISGYSGFSGISGWSGESGYSGFSGISGYSGDSGISGYSGDSGISGYSGDSGISGYSGDSGISGFSGESGTSGYSGFSGQQGTSINVKGEVPTVGDLPPTGNQVNDAYIVTADGNLWVWNGSAWYDAGQIVGPQGLSGFSGYSGESGYSGFSGDSGISGWSGESGISGFSGDSGISGWSGFSGESGYSGLNGDSGYSGISGYSGFSGDSGISGWSGDSGISGYSGDSGISGWSGDSGISGFSGDSGISGYSGWSGEIGTSGFSGESGYSGFSGISGYSGSGVSGYSGYSGAVGTSGYSGYSGAVGESGYSGISGWSGISGYSGFSGISGYSGAVGQSSSLFTYYAEAVQTSGQPATGYLLWNTATQSNATQININHLTNDGSDIDIFLALLQPTQKFIIQDQNVSSNYQSWLITGATTNVNAGTGNSYWTVPVSLISSGGTGTTDFADNHPLFLAITAGVSGTSGYSGYSGFSGISGWSGISGASGISGQNGASGFSGTSGFSGISGYSGFSGISGQNGASGYSGYSGISGTNGASGFSGISGYSGYSGINGASGFSGISGFSGYSGISGYSGSGVSGYSGFSGISGYSGYSGITPTIGGSNTQVQYNNSGVLGGSANLIFNGTGLGIGVSPIATGLAVKDSIRVVGATTSSISFSNAYNQNFADIFYDDSTGNFNIFNTRTYPLILGVNNIEKMRFTGNNIYTASGVAFAIGTSSVVEALTVNGAIAVTGGITGHGANRTTLSQEGANGAYWQSYGANTSTYGTFKLRQASSDFSLSRTAIELDAQGNLGLGVTPSAWGTVGYIAMQFPSGGSISAYKPNNAPIIHLSSNLYHDDTNERYVINGAATRYSQNQGVHSWSIAPSGTAGNTISFTQAMTLGSNGFLGIGQTSPAYPIDISTGANSAQIAFQSTISSGTNFKIAQGIQGVTNSGMQIYDLTNSAVRLCIQNDGNVLIGTTSSIGNGGILQAKAPGGGPVFYGETNSSSGSQNVIDIANVSNTAYKPMRFWVNGYGTTEVGSITCTTVLTSYNQTSDYRLKENIAPMTGALAKVAQLNPVTYKWKTDGSDGQGFIAHELAEVVPDCVTGEKDAVDENGKPQYQAMDTSHLIATLTKAIQEQQALIESLTTRLIALENK